jgi:hypothetical protein
MWKTLQCIFYIDAQVIEHIIRFVERYKKLVLLLFIHTMPIGYYCIYIPTFCNYNT